MMRRIRSWWALLAMTTMVLASLMVPLQGAAYPIPDGPGPVEGGEPDEPNDGPVLGKNQPVPDGSILLRVIIIQPLPGVLVPLSIRIPFPASICHARARRR